MKKKIVFVLVCTLVFATLTASASVNIKNTSNITKPNIFLIDDVPIWENGYSWTYTGELDFGNESMPLYIDFNELDLQITDDSGSTYKAIFGGDIDGEFIVDPDMALSIVIEEFSGEIIFVKSNIGISDIVVNLVGKPKLNGSILPVPADATITISFTPEYALIDFPISVGKDWIVPSSHIDIEIFVSILGIIEDTFNFDDDTGDVGFECLKKENVTAGGNTFFSYKITPTDSGDSRGVYYCADVGNEVLFEYEPGVPAIELLATNYPAPNNPFKPDAPLGPLTGKKGQTYTYTTKATDPDDNQIKYGWDFNGDFFADKWTGFFDSNETADISYTWEEMGDFEIRVKARDTTNKESVWSDPLSVTIPKNRVSFRPLLMFLQNHPYLFPVLRILLQKL